MAALVARVDVVARCDRVRSDLVGCVSTALWRGPGCVSAADDCVPHGDCATATSRQADFLDVRGGISGAAWSDSDNSLAHSDSPAWYRRLALALHRRRW